MIKCNVNLELMHQLKEVKIKESQHGMPTMSHRRQIVRGGVHLVGDRWGVGGVPTWQVNRKGSGAHTVGHNLQLDPWWHTNRTIIAGYRTPNGQTLAAVRVLTDVPGLLPEDGGVGYMHR